MQASRCHGSTVFRSLLRSSQPHKLCKISVSWLSSRHHDRLGFRPFVQASGRDPDPVSLGTSSHLITSSSNPYVKHCVRLRESNKYRNEARRALLVGETLLQELSSADSKHVTIRAIITTQTVQAVAAVKCDRIVVATPAVMKKICGLETVGEHAVAAEVDLPAVVDFSEPIIKTQRLLALEGVQDPGNMGTLLRTALAFGWDGAFLLPGCCDPFNDKALRASRGAAFKLPIGMGSWEELRQLAQRQELMMLAAEPTASGPAAPLGELAGLRRALHDRRVCLVLGTEGQGLSEDALGTCRPLAIPMAGDMESLNVGTAGGILMFMLGPNMLDMVDQLGALYLDDAKT